MRRLVASASIALALAGCADRERPIAYGEDVCDFCRMTISDPRFGAELITSRGRVRVFDSIECVASFASSLPASEPPRRILVTDFTHPGSFIRVEQARFARVPGPGSPMGHGLRAYARTSDTTAASGGATMSWEDVLMLVTRERLDPGSPRPGDSLLHSIRPPGS